MSYFVSKIGHLDSRFYSIIYCDTRGPDVGGPDFLLYFQNWTSRPPLLQSYILCNTRGPMSGVQMSGVQMSWVQMSGVQMSGVQMSGV